MAYIEAKGIYKTFGKGDAAAEGGHCPGPDEGRSHHPGGRTHRGIG